MVATIDEYSVATVPLEMAFNGVPTAIGTAFVWQDHAAYFLITNWHNFSGRDPFTGAQLSASKPTPNQVRVHWNKKGKLGARSPTVLAIRDSADKPLWWVHPTHQQMVDVIAMPITAPNDADMYPINNMPSDPLLISIGADVFILGYPFGIGPGGLPIWKRASLASEPAISPTNQLFLLVDTASRPGMSGSPTIRRSWGSHVMENQSIAMGPGSATRFIGVYSGRLHTNDTLDAQLGLVWPEKFIPEIIAGQTVDKLT